MKTYTIHHFITPLLTKGHVDGELEPDLFEAMMKRLSDIKDALYPLGATVKTSTMRKGIMLDAIPEEMLDEIEHHIHAAKEYIELGVEELQVANQYAASSRKR